MRAVHLAGLASVMALAFAPASATPVAYTFETSAASQVNGSAEIQALLGPSPAISGSLVYDASAPSVADAPSSPTANLLYFPAFTGLQGTIEGHGFQADTAFAVKLPRSPIAPPGLNLGALILSTSLPFGDVPVLPAGSLPLLAGFTLGGYELTNISVYWLAATSGQALPSNLSSTVNPVVTLSLEFTPVATAGTEAAQPVSVMITGIDVAPAVPEPATGILLSLGLGAVAAMRARRPGAGA